MKFITIAIILCKIIESIITIRLYNQNELLNISFDQLFKFSNNNKNKYEGVEANHRNIVYKVYVIHQGNKILEEGIEKKFKVDFDKDGNMIFSSRGFKKKLDLNELLFIDDKVVFTIPEIATIHSKIYKQFINSNFMSAINKLSQLDNNVEKYGIAILHHKFGEDDKSLEKDLLIIFCPTLDSINENSAERQIQHLINSIQAKYHSKLINEKNFVLNIPEIIEKLDNFFMYWNGLDKFNEVSKYIIGFANEGVLLNNNANRTLQEVKFAFRYDQLYECDGTFNSTGPVLSAKIKQSLPIPSCCVGYNVDWHGHPGKELFCSDSTSAMICENQINIFKRIVFKKCVEKGVNQLGRLLEISQNLEQHKLPTLRKIKFKMLLDDLNKHDLFKKVDNKNKYKKYFDIVKSNLDNLLSQLGEALKGINVDEVMNNTPKSRINNNYSITPTKSPSGTIKPSNGIKIESENNNTPKSGINNKKKNAIDKSPSSVTKPEDDFDDDENNSGNKNKDDSITENKIEDVLPTDSDDNASNKSNEENQNELKKAEKTVELSKQVIKKIEKSLGHSLKEPEIIKVIDMVNKFTNMFKQMLDRDIPITYEYLKKFEEDGLHNLKKELKRNLKNNAISISTNEEIKDIRNNDTSTQILSKNNTELDIKNLTVNNSNSTTNNISRDKGNKETLQLPIDESSEYMNDDDSLSNLARGCTEEKSGLNKIVDLPKNKTINIPYSKKIIVPPIVNRDKPVITQDKVPIQVIKLPENKGIKTCNGKSCAIISEKESTLIREAMIQNNLNVQAKIDIDDAWTDLD